MGVDANLYAIDTNEQIWLGRAYRVLPNIRQESNLFSTTPYPKTELLSLIDKELALADKSYLASEEYDEDSDHEFYPLARMKMFLESREGSFYLMDDYTEDAFERYEEISAFKEVEYFHEKEQAWVKAHLNSLEVVVFLGAYDGRLWAIAQGDLGMGNTKVRTRLLGVKTKDGLPIYGTVSSSMLIECPELVVADR